MSYDFLRDFYYLMNDSIKENSVTFLLGTRKCGKTVCLHQLERNIEHTKYVDFKTVPITDKQADIFNNILDSINKNEGVIYLLDEITYVENAEGRICEIANALAETDNTKTKLVFTGSQSVALNAWADRAFAGNANKISVDFLTYSEFLRYKGLTEHTPETYNQFLYEVADFYKFTSLENYLKGCIEETIVSNAKASNCIFDNECNLIQDKVDLLVNICYQTMFTLHNNVTSNTFFKNNKLRDTIIGTFHETCKKLGNESIASRIENSFIGGYSNIKSQDLDTLRQAFVFLKKCGLISITPIARELDSVPDVYRSMKLGKNDINCKTHLFEKFNITIDHPMFYVQILKDILKEEMPSQLSGTLLGSIVECHVRGLLPNGFEYKTTIDKNGIETECEIDYINLSDNLAVELTISVNHGKNFEILPNYMKNICLTRNENKTHNGIQYVDYCSYLFELSQKRHLSHNINIDYKPPTPQISDEIASTVNRIAKAAKKVETHVSEIAAEEISRVQYSFEHIVKQIEHSFGFIR